LPVWNLVLIFRLIKNQSYDKKSNSRGLIERVETKVERALRDMYSEDLVDLDSAAFSVCGNELSLDSVDVNEGQIKERVTEAVRGALLDYFPAPKQLETA